MRRISALLVGCFILLLSTPAFATGLHGIGTDNDVYIDTVNVEVDVRGAVADSVMEFTVGADQGTANFASLRFPLPPDSVIHKAEIYLPDQERWETARTLGRREAAEAAGGQSEQPDAPLLLQHIGRDFYRAQVSPISSEGNLRLRVHYAHPLETTSRGHLLRVAFANPDASESTPTNGLKVVVRTDTETWYTGRWDSGDGEAFNASFDPDEGFGRVGFGQHPLGEDVTLSLEREGGAFGHFVASWAAPEDSDLRDHVYASWSPDIGDVPDADPAPRNVVFVIDNSGSMYGEKLLQTKIAVGRAIASLEPSDRFGLVAFGSESSRFSSEMRAGGNVEGALNWLSNLDTAGGTNMEAGIREAMNIAVDSEIDRPIDLMLVSDGRPNSGASTAPELLRVFRSIDDSMDRKRRIFALGMGYDLSQNFINELSIPTDGEATFALDDSAVTGQFLELFDRTRTGGVFDVEADIQAGDGIASYRYARLFPGEVISLGTRTRGADRVELAMEAYAGDEYEYVLRTQQVDMQEASAMNVAAPLSAAATVRHIQRRLERNGENPELVAQAVHLSKTYGIVTRYASLIAFDSAQAYETRGIQDIPRNEAGIALVEVEASSEDERRIGGQGTWDYAQGSASGYSSDQASTCTTTPDRPTPSWLFAVIALLGFGLLRRRDA
ncbi:MAG: VWA domain-containing protein [Myxococcota bacterium]